MASQSSKTFDYNDIYDMKKYFALSNHGKLVYLGEFDSYSDAYEYAEYEKDINFIWIFKESKLEELRIRIDTILNELQFR